MKTDLSELYIEPALNVREGVSTKPGWYFIETKNGLRALVHCVFYCGVGNLYFTRLIRVDKRDNEKSGRFTLKETAKHWPVKDPYEGVRIAAFDSPQQM